MERTQSGAARIGGFVALAMTGLLAFEAAARIEDWVQYRTPLLSRARSEDDLVVRDARGAHGRPHAQFEKWAMNGLGARGPEAAELPPEGVTRIVAMGASETFGLFETTGQEWPRQLEGALRSRCGPRGIEILNAALPGMTLPTLTQDVALRIGQWRPHIILLYPSPQQYLAATRPNAAPPDSSPGSHELPAAYAWHPRAIGRLRDQFKGMLEGPILRWLRERDVQASLARSGEQAYATLPVDRLQAFDADLRRFVGTVRTVGAAPLLATHGNKFVGDPTPDPARLMQWRRFYPLAAGDLLLRMDSAAAEVTRTVAADSGVGLADVRAATAGGGSRLYADHVHFTDAGAQAASAAWLPVLLPRLGCVS